MVLRALLKERCATCYRSRFRFSTPTRWQTYGTGPMEDWKRLPPQQPEPVRIRSPSPLPDQLARSISVRRKNGRNEGRTRRRASIAAWKKRESHPYLSAQTRKSTIAPKLPRIRANRKLPLTKSTGRLPGRRQGRNRPGRRGRQLSKRSRVVVVVRPIKGGKVRSA